MSVKDDFATAIAPVTDAVGYIFAVAVLGGPGAPPSLKSLMAGTMLCNHSLLVMHADPGLVPSLTMAKPGLSNLATGLAKLQSDVAAFGLICDNADATLIRNALGHIAVTVSDLAVTAGQIAGIIVGQPSMAAAATALKGYLNQLASDTGTAALAIGSLNPAVKSFVSVIATDIGQMVAGLNKIIGEV